MNRTTISVTVLVVFSWFLAGGCGDRSPAPPGPSPFKSLKLLVVAPDDLVERRMVTSLETARVGYMFRLNVLKGYYEQIGNMDKLNWAGREIKNLSQTRTFKWQGVPSILPPQGESLSESDERILVEHVVSARNNYKASAAKLRDYYQRSNQIYRAKVMANMQRRLDPIRTYMYFLSAEIPPADLKATKVVPAADKLYFEARDLHEKSKGLILLRMGVNYPNQRRALKMMLELIRKYPHSSRVSMAAYYIAEIYKEYFNENLRAVHWYERAWQWNPSIPKPARFQAAVIHDLRLYNTQEALKCYNLALKHETFNSSNIGYARDRVKHLSKKVGK